MKWVVRIVVALFFSFVFFGPFSISCPSNRWLSAAVAMAVAVFMVRREKFDLLKKGYDARKAPYELRELQRKGSG